MINRDKQTDRKKNLKQRYIETKRKTENNKQTHKKDTNRETEKQDWKRVKRGGGQKKSPLIKEDYIIHEKRS